MSSRLFRMGLSGAENVRAERGDGVHLILDDGRRVIDAMNTPAPLGHLHPRVVEYVSRALHHSPTLDEGWSTSEREKAAETILGTAFAGEDWVGAIRFGVTGSEVNDLALSLCQALSGHRPFITRERAYHGMVGLARDLTVQPQWHGGLSDRRGGVRPVPPAVEVRVLPFPERRFGQGLLVSPDEAKSVLAESDTKFDGAAAVIIDYTQGGCYSTPAYQDEVARLAAQNDVLWIADEVITGFGKSGVWFNFQRGEARPDIVTLGKGMGGGVVPAAAIVLSKRVLDLIGDAAWQNYSSLRSSDMAAAASRAFVEVIAEEGLVERVDQLHHLVCAGMQELAAKHPSVKRIDGRGLHWWVEMEGDDDWREWRGDVAELPLATLVAQKTLEAGALVTTSGERAALIVTLPMTIVDQDVADVMAALDHGLSAADQTRERTAELHA